MHTLLALLLAVAAPRPGTVVWRHPLDAPAAAQPAVASDGRIAQLIRTQLHVLDSGGHLLAALGDVSLPFQPFWSGPNLWFRTKDGWRSWSGTTVSAPCLANVPTGAGDGSGGAIFAAPGLLLQCAPEPKILARRRSGPGAVWPLKTGWVVSDDWYTEWFDGSGTSIVALSVIDSGVVTTTTTHDEVLVVSQAGRLDAYDARGKLLWKGPPGTDAMPVEVAPGVLAIAGNRSVSLLDPPFVRWTLPVPAGAKALVAMADGSVAVLDRLGNLAATRGEGTTWGARVRESGGVLGAHDSGLILTIDNGQLVALAAPVPAAKGSFERAKQPAREFVRTGPPPEAATKGGGKLIWTQPCGAGCAATLDAGTLVIARDRQVSRLSKDRKKRTILASDVDTKDIAGLDIDGGRISILHADGALDRLAADGTRRRFGFPSDKQQRLAAFGETICTTGGCMSGDTLAPALDLTPRALSFGEEVSAVGAAVTRDGKAFWKAGGPVDALARLADESTAVLANGVELTVIDSSGKVRWRATLKGGACTSDRWLAVPTPELLVVHGCSEISAFSTGLRGRSSPR